MPVSLSEISRLEAIVGRVLGAPGKIDVLPSGTTGLSYLVTTESGRYVAKVFSPDSHVLLGPAKQFELLEVLAGTGIAPRPVGFDVEARLLVTAFLEGATPATSERLGQHESIKALALGLKTLHSVSADIPHFIPEAFAERYLARIGGLQLLSARDRQRYDELLKLSAMLESEHVGVCHNDLTAENLLFDAGLKLIDFDYAAIGPPVIDLASAVVMNGLADRESSALLDAYFVGEGPFSATEFARVQRLVRLLAHFWSLASKGAGAAIVGRYRIEDV